MELHVYYTNSRNWLMQICINIIGVKCRQQHFARRTSCLKISEWTLIFREKNSPGKLISFAGQLKNEFWSCEAITNKSIIHLEVDHRLICYILPLSTTYFVEEFLMANHQKSGVKLYKEEGGEGGEKAL